MNFREIATEIMLTANEEKWYETRQRIEDALVRQYRLGWSDGTGKQPDLVPRHDRWPGHIIAAAYSIDHWRDQPDGVR